MRSEVKVLRSKSKVFESCQELIQHGWSTIKIDRRQWFLPNYLAQSGYFGRWGHGHKHADWFFKVISIIYSEMHVKHDFCWNDKNRSSSNRTKYWSTSWWKLIVKRSCIEIFITLESKAFNFDYYWQWFLKRIWTPMLQRTETKYTVDPKILHQYVTSWTKSQALTRKSFSWQSNFVFIIVESEEQYKSTICIFQEHYKWFVCSQETIP